MQESDTGGVVIGTDLKTSKEAVELAEKHDFLWASVGLHPNDNHNEQWIDISIQMEELAKHPKVVGIGECGLDYFRSGGSDDERAAQKAKFETQVALAVSVQKPLIIHCRNAHDDMLPLLVGYKVQYGDALSIIIHFFTGTGELAQKYLDLGCYLSFPGPVTYTDMYDESIRVAPMDRILSETDSPFAAPVPHRGKRNEPVYVSEVVRKIAHIKNVSMEEVSERIILNSQDIFGITLQK